MAIESIRDRIFTSRTDIWSLGVVIWEIFTFGATPYETLSNDKILDYLLEGGRLENSDSIPKIFWNMVKLCWLEESNDRPNSTYIKASRKSAFEIFSFNNSNFRKFRDKYIQKSKDFIRLGQNHQPHQILNGVKIDGELLMTLNDLEWILERTTNDLKEASENFIFDFADISNTMTSSDLERTYKTSVDIFCNNANMF